MLKIIEAKGNSMLHFICNGNKLIYDSEKYSIDVGDIVIYEVEGQKVAHRILYIKGEQIIVAGDNCRKFEHINATKILGKVIILLKNNKRFKVSCNNTFRNELVEFLREFIILNDKYIDFVLLNQYGPEYEKCLELYRNRNIKQQKYLESVEI